MVCLFAYGSLVFKPPEGLTILSQSIGVLRGYKRIWAMSSWDHRGTPASPGRVVTLTASPDDLNSSVVGVILDLGDQVSFAQLDDREKAGYIRVPVTVELLSGQGAIDCITYLAGENVPEYLCGERAESHEQIARVIFSSVGPSGPNIEYFERLRGWLQGIGVKDAEMELIAAILDRLKSEKSDQKKKPTMNLAKSGVHGCSSRISTLLSVQNFPVSADWDAFSRTLDPTASLNALSLHACDRVIGAIEWFCEVNPRIFFLMKKKK
jgi:cation transport protein ChaC